MATEAQQALGAVQRHKHNRAQASSKGCDNPNHCGHCVANNDTAARFLSANSCFLISVTSPAAFVASWLPLLPVCVCVSVCVCVCECECVCVC